MQQLIEHFAIRPIVPERPQLRRQRPRRRLQECRQIDVIGAKAYAIFPQAGAGRLPYDIIISLR